LLFVCCCSYLFFVFPLTIVRAISLTKSNDSDSNIKIADFGFAKKCPKPQSLTTQCGTPGYVAPEILEGLPYDTQADMWSLGVIVVRTNNGSAT
jgi:serine/threonine protein kinase